MIQNTVGEWCWVRRKNLSHFRVVVIVFVVVRLVAEWVSRKPPACCLNAEVPLNCRCLTAGPSTSRSFPCFILLWCFLFFHSLLLSLVFFSTEVLFISVWSLSLPSPITSFLFIIFFSLAFPPFVSKPIHTHTHTRIHTCLHTDTCSIRIIYLMLYAKHICEESLQLTHGVRKVYTYTYDVNLCYLRPH